MGSRKSICVHLVEDDRPVKRLLERELDGSGPTVIAIHSGDQAADLFNQRQLDTIQLDFEVPGLGRIETERRQNGADDFELIRLGRRGGVLRDDGEEELAPTLPADTDAPLRPAGEDFEPHLGELGEAGGYQFLTRPLSASDLDHIALAVKTRRDYAPAPAPTPFRPREAPARPPRRHNPILGNSKPMLELLAIVHRVAVGSASVLIHGETGTGKTLIARELHDSSPRASERFVAINCSAFQDQLLESELFGHEKGSFTGAALAKEGLFEVAHQGTLFLDEVGNMSPAMQAKLLQVLDDGELRRVGGTRTRKIDARVLAATNKDLQQEVRAGRFREDLLFRLNVINLRVPPLAERREDIPVLVEHFLDRFRMSGQPRKQISPEALRLLMAYDWPGNVRELANTIEGLILLALGPVIAPDDLPPNLRPTTDFRLGTSEKPLPLAEIERLHILSALRFTEGKKAPAARLLGIDVKTLRNKIQTYGIDA